MAAASAAIRAASSSALDSCERTFSRSSERRQNFRAIGHAFDREFNLRDLIAQRLDLHHRISALTPK
jgi:hypothetical protein